MQRGYFGIGIVGCKTKVNIGTLWRSAHNFGAAFLVMIAPRYGCPHERQASDTTNARLHIPYYSYETFELFMENRPWSCALIGVEQAPGSRNLQGFLHPHRAIYLLGAEDSGLPERVMGACQSIIHIETPMCLNVSVAGSIVMYDRQVKGCSHV